MRLVPLLCLLAAAPALGQPVVGVTAGATASHLDKADGADSPTRLGIALGATVEVPLASRLSLQAGALYVDKGEADPDREPPFRDLKLAYLEVPVAVVLTVPTGGLEARLSAGGFVARPVAGDVGQRSGASPDTDYGALAGAGLRRGPLVLDARVELGLRGGQFNRVNGEAQTRTLALTLGYRLGGG